MPHILSLSLFYLLFFISGAYSFQLNDDLLALIVFKSDLIDPQNALKSWNEDDNSPCNWEGIVCNAENGRVITLNLNGLSLSGHIGRTLAKLEYIETISLSNNNISGSITQEIEELSQLEHLSTLDLSQNKLFGTLDDIYLGDFPSLKSFDLSNNEISGPISSDFFRDCKPTLSFLSLSGNAIQGSIPTSIDSCTNLHFLNLSKNHIVNDIPDLASLHDLSIIDLSNNALSGGLPKLGPNVIEVHFHNNKLLGSVYKELVSFPMLQILDLSNNVLSGEIPATIGGSLIALNLANNFISGSIPSWASSSLSSLEVLNLSYNALEGEIPSTIGDFEALKVVDLSQNRLSGEGLRSLSRCDKLRILDLSSNNFSGSFPEAFPSHLLSLKLSNNQLRGQIPANFYSKCGSFQVLDLSLNWLQGSVSQLFISCGKLEYLNMSHNFLSGGIPTFQDELNALIMMDLSHNRFVGSIPSSIGYGTQLVSLLLNANKLNGSIPSQVGNCSSLRDINLSYNSLYGDIPPELGNLTHLQMLDISHNNITGAIPPELGQLQSLAHLNVSYNHLEGPIPDYGNLERFDKSAFIGNSDLCGSSVNVTCPSVMPKPIVLNPNTTNISPAGEGPLLLTPERHHHIMLSATAILAISAAIAIMLGVIVVFILNTYAQSSSTLSAHSLGSFSNSPSSDIPIGKLVMFSKSADPRSEEWITSAHALLNKDCEVGRGGFGTVYKALLADGRTVAIKKLMVSSLVKSQSDFEKEIQCLGQMKKHRNLLTLQGYYWTPQLQLLIYDFIPNGNLYMRLHEKSQGHQAILTWPARFKIGVGVARALAHLHHTCHPQIIHYNMKSSNVLLDECDNPKVADYGLAKLLPMMDRYLMSSKFQSALGYMAPEFACQSSRINEKCDVYGYGVMLLELVTGRRPVEYMEDDVVILCDYVRSMLDEGTPMNCVDRNLGDSMIDEEVLPVIKLGLICTSQVPSNRPSMAEVVQILELIKTPTNSKDLL